MIFKLKYLLVKMELSRAMKLKLYFSIIILLFIMLTHFCTGDNGTEPADRNDQEFRGAYLGQTPPGMTPVEFLPEIITYPLHSSPVFSPSGDEVFWTPMTEQNTPMQYMRRNNDGVWSSPQEAHSYISSYDGSEPFFSYDGNRLFFNSCRPPNSPGLVTKENIWYVDRVGESWSEPQPLGPEINSHILHWVFSVAQNGNLYFIGEESNNINADIYCSKYFNGEYSTAEKLPEVINTDGMDMTPYIAPDESYLIFSHRGNDTYDVDLYISFKDGSGNWGAPVNMEILNTQSAELAPFVTYDGEYLFFLSSRSGVNKAYWIDAGIIDNYR